MLVSSLLSILFITKTNPLFINWVSVAQQHAMFSTFYMVTKLSLSGTSKHLIVLFLVDYLLYIWHFSEMSGGL